MFNRIKYCLLKSLILDICRKSNCSTCATGYEWYEPDGKKGTGCYAATFLFQQAEKVWGIKREVDMNHWLDNYINGENLAPDDLRYMYHYPLHMFAYEMKDYDDYESIKGRLAILQKTFYRGYHFKDVSYILDQTGLTKWQKLWLKIQYVMF